MAKKKSASASKKKAKSKTAPVPVDAIKHKDSRTNIPNRPRQWAVHRREPVAAPHVAGQG